MTLTNSILKSVPFCCGLYLDCIINGAWKLWKGLSSGLDCQRYEDERPALDIEEKTSLLISDPPADACIYEHQYRITDPGFEELIQEFETPEKKLYKVSQLS